MKSLLEKQKLILNEYNELKKSYSLKSRELEKQITEIELDIKESANSISYRNEMSKYVGKVIKFKYSDKSFIYHKIIELDSKPYFSTISCCVNLVELKIEYDNIDFLAFVELLKTEYEVSFLELKDATIEIKNHFNQIKSKF